jgi:hypothetical protein
MAQPIHCDAHNREHLADVLVSQIANGDTAAFCFAGYIDVCRALVEDVEAQAAEAARAMAAEAERSGAADQAEALQAEAEALERLEDVTPVSIAAELAAGLAAEGMAPAEAAAYAVDTTPAKVVRKGTSRSRKAHEARQRAARTKVAPETTEPAIAAPVSTAGAREEETEGEPSA